MGVDDSDGPEIDLLIRDLTKPRVPRKTTPAVSRPLAPQADVAKWVASQPAERRPAGRWMNARWLMPSVPVPGFVKGLAFGSAITVPPLPDLRHVLGVSAPVTMVRIWVGLGMAHSAAMTFWPYPKTYFWGLVLYLLSLALVLVTGIWGARLSWQERLGGAHTLALGTVVWAVTLAAAETLSLM